jgi:hypothetical protein
MVASAADFVFKHILCYFINIYPFLSGFLVAIGEFSIFGDLAGMLKFISKLLFSLVIVI